MRARLLVPLVLALAGCPPAEEPTTVLKLRGEVRDASVTVDDQYVGALAWIQVKGLVLPRGKHRVTVEKAGYFPWDKVVEANEPLHLEDVKLEKIPD